MGFWGHLCTVLTHKKQVWKLSRKAGIPFQGLAHDLSKFSPSEFLPGARHYQGGKRSPNEQEREILGYSTAWLHHKGRNRHHFEYRIAASKTYLGKNFTEQHPLDYFLKGKPNRFIHPETSDFIEKMLTLLRDKGEDEMFLTLRNMLKESRKNGSQY